MAPRTEPAPAGMLAALRAATRPVHEAIDGAFDGGLRTAHDYRRYLRALLPLACWLDASWRREWPQHLACWHDPGRVACLRDDLAGLGDPAVSSTRAAPATVAEWMGGCYVIEGSALGARLLSRDVAAMPFEAGGKGPPRSFLDRHLGDPGRWPRFRAALEVMAPDHLPAALRGAGHGFALVAAALAREGRTA